MRKKLIIITVLFLLIAALIGYISYDSRHGSLTSFTISYHSLESDKLPKSFNDVSVMFLSDIEYGTYFNSDRLKKLESRLKNTACDIVIFGGDLFDRNYALNSDDIETITAFLKGISAPLGKFAILGDLTSVIRRRRQLSGRSSTTPTSSFWVRNLSICTIRAKASSR